MKGDNEQSLTDKQVERVGKLLWDLSKPMFLFRMHGPANNHGHAPVRDKAAEDIDRIVQEYCNEDQLCLSVGTRRIPVPVAGVPSWFPK